MDGSLIAAWRMHRHHLWGAPLVKPAEVVKWFGAMQAQEFVPAKWAIGQRTEAAVDSTIERLHASGELVRTHVIRPTWHFAHRDDIRWLLEATRARVHRLNGTYYRRFGVDGATFERCAGLFTGALEGGNELNRKELVEVLRAGGVEVATGLHMSYVLMRAELEAVIISGSVGGKAPTYALFDERVPAKPSYTHEESVAELTRRYFVSRGPATLRDFARWSSLTVAEARRGLGLAISELERTDLGGRTYYHARSGVGTVPRSPVVDLIQGYDEYVMSYSETKDIIHRADAKAGAINPYLHPHAILLDGLLAGHWRFVRRPKEITAEVVLFRPFDERETAALDVAANRLGDHFDLPAAWVAADT